MANPAPMTVSDTAPDLVVTLYNASTAQDLTGTTVVLNLRLAGASTTSSYPCSLSDTPDDGNVTTNRGFLSAVAAGLYAAEWRVTFTSGAVSTWPTPGHQDILFKERRT